MPEIRGELCIRKNLPADTPGLWLVMYWRRDEPRAATVVARDENEAIDVVRAKLTEARIDHSETMSASPIGPVVPGFDRQYRILVTGEAR